MDHRADRHPRSDASATAPPSVADRRRRAALDHADVDPATVDLVLLATTTPDQHVPATSSQVQDELGVVGGAFDLDAACSGFVYGLVTAHGLLATGMRRILLIGAETLSRITDWEDRDTAVLFGDGGGAVVLDAADDEHAPWLGPRRRRQRGRSPPLRGLGRHHAHGRARRVPTRPCA
ncbi:MAG: hypothetical protein U5R31_14530 [Acidimicrobiia bacterium]|nr:hypothetical protein [Acidimicrobiia bacterium]